MLERVELATKEQLDAFIERFKERPVLGELVRSLDTTLIAFLVVRTADFGKVLYPFLLRLEHLASNGGLSADEDEENQPNVETRTLCFPSSSLRSLRILGVQPPDLHILPTLPHLIELDLERYFGLNSYFPLPPDYTGTLARV